MAAPIAKAKAIKRVLLIVLSSHGARSEPQPWFSFVANGQIRVNRLRILRFTPGPSVDIHPPGLGVSEEAADRERHPIRNVGLHVLPALYPGAAADLLIEMHHAP